MTATRHILLAVLLMFTLPAQAATLSAEKRADIHQLLAMTGALSIGKQVGVAYATQMAETLKKARPDIPDEVFKAVTAEVQAVFDERGGQFLDESVVPMYDKYFTGPEIKEMIRFYGTDLGQKAIRVMPALVNESMQLGQQWGQSLAPVIEQRVLARLKKEWQSL